MLGSWIYLGQRHNSLCSLALPKSKVQKKELQATMVCQELFFRFVPRDRNQSFEYFAIEIYARTDT